MKRNPGLDPAAVEDVLLGCANQAGEDNRNVARMALLLAGLPESVPGATVNRLCGSGLDAVAMAARAIRTGEAQLVVAGGVESMSRAPFVIPKAEALSAAARRSTTPRSAGGSSIRRLKAQYGIDSMPETGENVAAQFQLSRADQDAFALRSQQRTAAAYARGFFAAELIPVEIAAAQGRPMVVEQRRASAPRDDAGTARGARPRFARDRHRHCRQRLGSERRRLRAHPRYGGGRAGAWAYAARARGGAAPAGCRRASWAWARCRRRAS